MISKQEQSGAEAGGRAGGGVAVEEEEEVKERAKRRGRAGIGKVKSNSGGLNFCFKADRRDDGRFFEKMGLFNLD
jgi:hypothetical protein